MDVPVTSAPAQRLVSQLKRLEVSGTAGNLMSPDPEVLCPLPFLRWPSMQRANRASLASCKGAARCLKCVGHGSSR